MNVNISLKKKTATFINLQLGFRNDFDLYSQLSGIKMASDECKQNGEPINPCIIHSINLHILLWHGHYSLIENINSQQWLKFNWLNHYLFILVKFSNQLTKYVHTSSYLYIGNRAFKPTPTTKYPIRKYNNEQTSNSNRCVVKCLNGYWVGNRQWE